jgi:hypothetical protein
LLSLPNIHTLSADCGSSTNVVIIASGEYFSHPRMSLLHDYWYVVALIVAELPFAVAMNLHARALREHMQRLVDEIGLNEGEIATDPPPPWRAVEVLFVVYHFPAILLLTLIGRIPALQWMIQVLTAILYSAFVFHVRTRHHLQP